MDQSNAILRYVGTLGGLYPSNDPLLAYKVDQIIDTVEDAGKYIGYTMMGPKGVFFQKDKSLTSEEVLDIRTKLMDPNLGEKNVAFVSICFSHDSLCSCCSVRFYIFSFIRTLSRNMFLIPLFTSSCCSFFFVFCWHLLMRSFWLSLKRHWKPMVVVGSLEILLPLLIYMHINYWHG